MVDMRVVLAGLLLTVAPGALEGGELIGTAPPEWEVTDWIHSPPLALSDLRGRVVLVRWWTAPHCPYCRASAPALNEFHREYRDRGLVVIGFYHHKSPTPLRIEEVRRHAADLGLDFPLAVDHEWKTLKSWWLDRRPRSWTSVTFLIDRRGTIRYIHPGGQYFAGDADYAELKAEIEKALWPEPAAPPKRRPHRRSFR